MEKPYCIYKLLKTENDSYFIGANTERGFVSSFDFSVHENDFGRLFILKGGPGTGKSTLMKKFAERCGEEPVYYYCSSDPASLDGAIVSRSGVKYAICDGTAPHVAEMNYPGASSEIINLGKYWNSAAIVPHRDEIVSLSSKKSHCFSAAYTYLKSAAEVQRSLDAVAAKACDFEKMDAAVSRLISKYKIKKGSASSVYTEAFSMRGCIAFDTFFRKAKTVYYVNDSFGIRGLFLSCLDRRLAEGKCEYTRIVSPVNTSVISGIYIDSAGVFITHNSFDEIPCEGKVINTKRFQSAAACEYKNRYSFAVKCHNALLSGASEYLSEACTYHFELEKIYVKAMNFRRIDRFVDKFTEAVTKSDK